MRASETISGMGSWMGMALAAAIRPSKIKQLLIISNGESSIDESIAYISAQLNSHAAALLSAQRQGHTIRAAHVDCVATRRYTACLGLHDGACLGRPRRGAAAPLPSLGAQSNCRQFDNNSCAATVTRLATPHACNISFLQAVCWSTCRRKRCVCCATETEPRWCRLFPCHLVVRIPYCC